MKHPERALQQQIVQTLRLVGGVVWELGTTRSRRDFHMGTRQTPGLPDLLAFLPLPPPRMATSFAQRLLVIEVKAPGGRLRPAQADFRACCGHADIDHIVGGLDDVLAWLVRSGYLKPDQVPHYRRPAAESDAR